MCVWTLTALSDGSRGGQVPVLSVHVVGAAARVVTQPDTKVLHLQRGLLVDLNQVKQPEHGHGLVFQKLIRVDMNKTIKVN